MIGTRCAAQMRTMSCTSSVDLRIDDGVGRLVFEPGDGVAVLLADRARGDETVAELRRQRGDGAFDRLGIAARRRHCFDGHGGRLAERKRRRQSAGAVFGVTQPGQADLRQGTSIDTRSR